MDKKVAWVFPGQGTQYPGMGKDFYEGSAAAKNVLDRSDEAFGGGLLEQMFYGTKETLTLTEIAQPAILALSVAQAEVLKENGLYPQMVAGLSLGEYSALVVAGCLPLEDGVRLTKERGRLMQEACPPGFGAMTAILGLSCADVESCCYFAQDLGHVIPANYNAPGQIVISGKKEAVEKAAALAVSKGGSAIPLSVSAPFHCQCMEPAAQGIKSLLDGVEIKKPQIQIYANVTANLVEDVGEIKDLLVKQVTHAVLWQTIVTNMAVAGAKCFVEVGPGKTLTGFAKRIVPDMARMNFGSFENVETILRQVKEAS